ncbi:hypothetical protein ACHAXR_007876 [Thalassiosira sp. AJA248-18]
MSRSIAKDPNHIYVMCTPTRPPTAPSTPRSKTQHAKSFDRRFTLSNGHDGDNCSRKALLYTFATAIVAMLMTIHLLTLNNGNSNNDNSRLRFSSSNQNQLATTNRFSYSKIKSPYEEIWINSHLPGWAKKKRAFRAIEDTIAPEERICYVHVGKAGGSSVGCGLGFSLHCNNSTQKPLGGLLPQRTTRLFHADTYDCHDNSAYFLFVVRNPVERIKSAFLYDRPKSEASLKKHFPEYYERRKNFYLDCPSFGVMERFVQDGLTKHGHATEVCKIRAFTALRGERHFSCHMYFNYQFHLEGIPENAKILTIRNEHLVQDWNFAEHFIGGEREIIPPEEANTTIGVMNKSTKDSQDKYLSEESTLLVCRQLCNEIVSYKKILRRSLNLNYQEIERSIEELRQTCPKYADYEEGDCPFPMPDITEKLIDMRGYEDVVMDTQRQKKIYDDIKSQLKAPPDFNNRNEYVFGNDGLSRVALGTHALMRFRVKQMLEQHETVAWWKDDVVKLPDPNFYCVEQFIALAIAMYDVTDWSLFFADDGDDFTPYKFDEEDVIFFTLGSLWLICRSDPTPFSVT